MSAGITVEDFKYVRGVNDAEYIELLKNAYEGQKYITSKAIAKLKKQRKTGYFIGTEFDGYADGSPVYYEWKCSECGCVFEDDEPTYNYCPNCGAKMEDRGW